MSLYIQKKFTVVVKKVKNLILKMSILFKQAPSFLFPFSIYMVGLYVQHKLHIHVLYLKKMSYFFYVWKKNAKCNATLRILKHLDTLPADCIFHYALIPVCHPSILLPYITSLGFARYIFYKRIQHYVDTFMYIVFFLSLQSFLSSGDLVPIDDLFLKSADLGMVSDGLKEPAVVDISLSPLNGESVQEMKWTSPDKATAWEIDRVDGLVDSPCGNISCVGSQDSTITTKLFSYRIMVITGVFGLLLYAAHRLGG